MAPDPVKLRAKARRKWRRRRDELVAHKLREGCVDCGYRDHPDVLQFDHILSVTVRSTQVNKRWKLERLLAETVVRCANCHAIRTCQQARERNAG